MGNIKDTAVLNALSDPPSQDHAYNEITNIDNNLIF